MPTPAKGPRLGAGPAHERLLLAGLATALFEHGRITTTVAKARRLRPYAEHLITFGKRGDLHARRRVARVIRDKGVLHTLFAEIGPRYAERPGGYTRITKVGPRKGDNAPMAVIELVEDRTIAQQAVGEAERARGTRFARRRGTPTAPAAAGEPAGAAEPAAGAGEADAAAESAQVRQDAAAAQAGEDLPAAGVAPSGDAEAESGATPAPTEQTATVPTEGDTSGTPEEADEQVAVPSEGGDTEVVTDPAGPGEAPSSAQTSGAGEESQAEGDEDRG